MNGPSPFFDGIANLAPIDSLVTAKKKGLMSPEDKAKLDSLSAGGGGAWAVIGSQTLTVATASVTFSSIPQTYRDLIIAGAAIGDSANTSEHVRLRANGDTTANYDWQTFVALGGTVAAASGIGDTAAQLAEVVSSGAATNVPGTWAIEILSYVGVGWRKGMRATSGALISLTDASGQRDRLASGYWRGTAAITALTLFPANGNFAAGSVITLYGRT